MIYHEAMKEGNTMSMAAKKFLQQPTLTDAHVTAQASCFPMQIPFLDASSNAGRSLEYTAMNPGNLGSLDWPNFYQPIDQDGNAVDPIIHSWDGSFYDNYIIETQDVPIWSNTAKINSTLDPRSGHGATFTGGVLWANPAIDSQYWSGGSGGPVATPEPLEPGTNPTSPPAPQGTCLTCEDMPDNAHCLAEAYTRFIVCESDVEGPSGFPVFYVVQRPMTSWSFDKSNGCHKFDKKQDAQGDLVDDKEYVPIDTIYYEDEVIRAQKTNRILIHASTCSTLYDQIRAIDSSLIGDTEKFPLPGGGFGYCVYSTWIDGNSKARKRGGGGGGVPTGFEEKCVTLCEDGEEITGEILFKEGCD